MLKCTINGIPVEVEEGATIIQAFKKTEQEIAHYCWHPGLPVAGVCRLCMVEIEGQPKLQIACNTLVQNGMVITNKSETVKNTVRWGLEFHMINHPLDCPICDQAGECILQEQYMRFGQYQPTMAENKVKKRKVVDLGSKIVLDTERCILCARCTRFTDHITKTKELGIFNRGDRSEIGTFTDNPLENDYALNTVDICPVGALTSKKFRFKQRVWYLKESPSICTGCSTGCNVSLYYNEEGLWRIQPRYNKEINQHWMCDKGRETYEHVNKKNRIKYAYHHNTQSSEKMKTSKALESLSLLLEKNPNTSLVMTGQYTLEEYDAFFSYYTQTLKSKDAYHWKNNEVAFDFYDEFLIRGDKNPNTNGLFKSAEDYQLNLKNLNELEEKISSVSLLIVCAPENPNVYPCLEDRIKLFLKAQNLIWIAPYSHSLFNNVSHNVWTIPSKTYFEKTGTFINAKGISQKIKAVSSVVSEAYSLEEIVSELQGVDHKALLHLLEKDIKTNHFLDWKGPI